MKLLTLDFGGTFVKRALIDENAQFTEKGKDPAPLESLDQFLQYIADKVAVYKNEIEGIAVSLPGCIDTERGFVYFAGRYTGIILMCDLGKMIEEKTGLRVTIENDAKAAILAEMWKGALQNIKDAAALIIGSGIGCGIIMDGKLRKGHNSAAGEISPVTCEPGQTGLENSLAGRASMTGFLTRVAEAKHMRPEEFETAGNAEGNKIGGEEVFGWLEAGDEETAKVYDAWLKDLTWLINMLKSTADPEKIVIGGGVSNNERFMKDLKAYYETYCNFVQIPGADVCRLERCEYSADANLAGAAYVWLQKYKETI